ncbi:hypothetical protein O6H91_07G128200 [Diphasiastrum complanatum]|uniref:Uncharacterized protein n=1 Tax=Diphasiastrum complanatum TaxID=34168 RepID=A0ACC2DA05_DIPCM|nr:hypothetical protein O6H91_07G128200 [Diphasiastrum complanatum]
MESNALLVFVVLMAVAACVGSASQPDCADSLTSLQPCLQYVQAQGQQSTPPGQDCCSALLQVHENKPVCLCVLIGSNNPLPEINITQATSLPAACKVNTDPSKCPALLAGGPTSPPSASTGSKNGTSDADSDSQPSFILPLIHTSRIIGQSRFSQQDIRADNFQHYQRAN